MFCFFVSVFFFGVASSFCCFLCFLCTTLVYQLPADWGATKKRSKQASKNNTKEEERARSEAVGDGGATVAATASGRGGGARSGLNMKRCQSLSARNNTDGAEPTHATGPADDEDDG